MDPLDDAAPARLEGQSTSNHMVNQPPELIDTKLTYSIKIISSSNTPNPPNCHSRDSVIATHTTQNGMPAVLFKATDYYGVMAEECKLTIVGRFLKPRPQIDKIRSKFKELISIKGSVKIEVYDNYNVFLDFTNEEDINTVWFRSVIEIEGQQMWLQKWSPNFKPGGPACCSVYVGQIYDNAPQKGFVQKIEFEGVPKYCKFCRKLGHNMINCRALERKKAAEYRELDAQKTGVNQNEENREVDAQKTGENQKDENRELNAQNSGANQNVENKGTEMNNNKEVSENGSTSNNGQDRDNITKNLLKQKNGKESDNHQQKSSSNIRERTRKKNKKSKQRKLSKKKAKVIFKPMLNLSDDTNRRKKLNKELTLAFHKLNQESNLIWLGVIKGSRLIIKQGTNLGLLIIRIPQVQTQASRIYCLYSNSETKEDQQESIQDNDSQNGNEDPENRKKEKKALNMNDYINESTSVPSEIKNLLGIDVVADHNMESDKKQDKYVTCHQIEVTSPNRVTIMVPEDKIQIDSKEESFQIIGNNMTTILNNHEQQLTTKLHYGVANSDLYITPVYTKCTPEERRELWSSLELTNL
ncbi:hypothetical protein A4A49_35251 [Nicotiana attenuata]|uniref:DUF4283 domain-containing protein n=1 Tax=Nicotiana attenuata TaxID=49451 RepID=A0A314KJB4_NICAT|nr:hypothetical protein A4A49_35251 [Nicotiana attenuata]